MNLKTITLVIIFAILIGAIIVFVPKFLQQSPDPTNSNSFFQNKKKATHPPPTPIPTIPPPLIDKDTNLKDTVKKMEVPDFKSDFENLRKELN